MCRYAAICLKIPIVRLPTCLRSRHDYPKYVVTLDELAAGNINESKDHASGRFLTEERILNSSSFLLYKTTLLKKLLTLF